MAAPNQVPNHIAIIMDGNNRWAKAQGMSAVASGHNAGAEGIRGVLQAARDAGVHALTLFAFSSENWERPKAEVDALMRLLARYLVSEIDALCEQGVRVRFIGRRDRFNHYICKLIDDCEQRSKNNTSAAFTIAADYGGRWDITQAAAKYAAQESAGVREQNNPEVFAKYLSLGDLPAPDLLIRTGGEQRISNFMLWQCAYSELYFTETYWPDFDDDELRAAIVEFQARERRFGKTAEQIKGQ